MRLFVTASAITLSATYSPQPLTLLSTTEKIEEVFSSIFDKLYGGAPHHHLSLNYSPKKIHLAQMGGGCINGGLGGTHLIAVTSNGCITFFSFVSLIMSRTTVVRCPALDSNLPLNSPLSNRQMN